MGEKEKVQGTEQGLTWNVEESVEDVEALFAGNNETVGIKLPRCKDKRQSQAKKWTQKARNAQT